MLLEVRPDALKQLRQSKNLTCYKVAVDAGLPLTAVYRLENGVTKKTNHLRAQVIADALGCDIEDICNLPQKAV